MAAKVDFSTLIGSHAHLAKQLDLRWRWELLPQAIHDDDQSSVEDAPPEERLVRKCRHSMPFLLRNVSNCPFRGRKNYRRHHRMKRSRKKTNNIDVITKCFGIGTPNKSKRKRSEVNPESPGLIRSIRKKITGWFSSNDDTKSEESDALDEEGQFEEKGAPIQLRPRPLTAYELFTSSPRVKQMVLRQVDPSLHHDEEFIRNRIDGCWADMTSDGFKSASDDENAEGDITSHAYWIDMEEKDKKKFIDDLTAHQNHQRRECQSNLSSPTFRMMNAATSHRSRIRDMTSVYFHYMYIHHNNNPATAVEKRSDRASVIPKSACSGLMKSALPAATSPS